MLQVLLWIMRLLPSTEETQAKDLTVCLSDKSASVSYTESGACKAALRLDQMSSCSKGVIYSFYRLDPCSGLAIPLPGAGKGDTACLDVASSVRRDPIVQAPRDLLSQGALATCTSFPMYVKQCIAMISLPVSFCHQMRSLKMVTILTFLAQLRGASQVPLVIKNPPANAGDVRDMGSIPRSGRFSVGGHGNPLQYSCLENSIKQRSLTGYGPCGCKEWNTTEVA